LKRRTSIHNHDYD